MGLERLPNETRSAYHKRLIYGKLVDKTLIDCDYSELAELVYGHRYSSDVARRMMYGSCKTLELLDRESIKEVAGTELADELDYKMAELQKERQRFFDQRREYSKLVNASGRAEHLEDRIIEAASKLDETIGVLYPYSTRCAKGCPVYDFSGQDTEAVLVLCDWHYGMVADNVWNQYNTEICKDRVRKVVEATAKRMKLHGCKCLHVVMLGDLIHGAIHVSARVASEELVCDQLMQVSEVLAQSIAELANYTDCVKVYTTYGNHARTVQNKKDNVHRDNMERIIPWWLKARLSNIENVEIVDESDTEITYLNVLGHGFCMSHGDLDGVKSSPRLFQTLFTKRFGLDVEYVLLADKHHREEFEELGVSSMIAGSLCGTDEYANGKRLYSTPEQLLLIVNEECGVDATYHLNVR